MSVSLIYLRVKDRVGQRLSEFGCRCHTRDRQEETKLEETVRMKTSGD